MAKSVTATAEKKKGKSTRPSKATITKLASDWKVLKADMDAARGEMGNMVQTAEENHGINRKAFKQACKLANMETIEAQADIRAMLYYCECLGVFDQADFFADLPKVT